MICVFCRIAILKDWFEGLALRLERTRLHATQLDMTAIRQKLQRRLSAQQD
jgi:hypothetical protein